MILVYRSRASNYIRSTFFSFWLNTCDHHNRVKTVTTPFGGSSCVFTVTLYILLQVFRFYFAFCGSLWITILRSIIYFLLTKNLPNALRRFFQLSFFAYVTINEFIWDTHISPDDDEVGRVPARPHTICACGPVTLTTIIFHTLLMVCPFTASATPTVSP